MIEENENEKNLQLIKIIACIVIYSVIGIVALFTLFVSKVKADTSPDNWYRDLKEPLYVQYYRWTSASANSNQTTEKFYWSEAQDTIQPAGDTINYQHTAVVNSSNFTITNYGLSIRITTQETMKSNYLYNFQIALCSTVSLNNVGFSKVSYVLNEDNDYSYGTKINLANDNSFSNCKMYSGITANDTGSNNLYIKIIATTNTSSGKYYLLGYNVQELGMWDENVRSIMQSVISSSGLATASSVQQVQQATEQVQQQVEEVNQQQQETNNLINDDSVDNPNSAIGNMSQNNTSNSVISDLLLLPVRLYQNILNSINGTCTTFNLGTLFNHNLTMPCINLSNYLGSALYNIIDVLISGIFVLSIRKSFVNIFENFTSLKTGGNELE